MKQSLSQIRNFISKHRVAFAGVGTATVFAILMRRNAAEIDKFLIEHNIDPTEFWTPDHD
jgi:hypothetical protein